MAVIRADVAAVLATARSQIGVTENPARSSRQKFGAWYGMNGVPWCAIFVSWVFWHAGHPLPRIATAKGFAYVPDVVAWAKANQCWKAQGPRPGDLVVFSFGGVRPDHVGIVEAVLSDGRVATIEGNTSGTNPRMGGMVARMHRGARIVGYVAVTSTAAPAPTPAPKPEPTRRSKPMFLCQLRPGQGATQVERDSVWWSDGITRVHVKDRTCLNHYQAILAQAGLPSGVIPVDKVFLDSIEVQKDTKWWLEYAAALIEKVRAR